MRSSDQRSCKVQGSNLNTGTGFSDTCLFVVISNPFIEPYSRPRLLSSRLILFTFLSFSYGNLATVSVAQTDVECRMIMNNQFEFSGEESPLFFQ